MMMGVLRSRSLTPIAPLLLFRRCCITTFDHVLGAVVFAVRLFLHLITAGRSLMRTIHVGGPVERSLNVVGLSGTSSVMYVCSENRNTVSRPLL